LKVLRQAKQAKWTLLVAVGTPGPFRIPATVVSSCAPNGCGNRAAAKKNLIPKST
jgi:hypothetical protein